MNSFMRLFTSLLLIAPKSSIRVLSNKRTLVMKKEKTILEPKETFFYKAKNENQKIYNKYLSENTSSIIFAIGPAGTGKTLLACNSAIKQFKSGLFSKIIITRPAVSVEEEEMGFLPGNLVAKMDPWTRPIFDIFSEFYTYMEIRKMIENNVIEIAPLAFMRGRTFKNAFIIADEMQNSSPNQMLMLTTRIGESSKMVITGDLNQSDKKDPLKLNGLADIINKYKKFNNEKSGIRLVEMTTSDIERNPIIITLMDIYGINVESKKTKEEFPIVKQNNETDSTNASSLSIVKNEKKVIQDAALIPIEHLNRIRNLIPSKEI